MRTLVGHTHWIYSVAFGSNSVLASAGRDQTIKLWHVKTRRVRTLHGHKHWVTSVAFSNDGSMLASGSGDGTIRLWRMPAGRLLATLTGRSDGSWLVEATDGRVDGPAGKDGGASLIDWQVGDIQLPGFVGWQRNHVPGLLGRL